MKRYIVAAISIGGMQLYAQSAEPASKGARVEATFILQNKHNTLLEHMQKVRKQLEDAEITKKKLKQEKEVLSQKLQKVNADYAKLTQGEIKTGTRERRMRAQNEQRKLCSLLSFLDLELRHASLITDLYPEYSKELDLLSLGLNKAIGEISETESMPYKEVRAEVDKSFFLRDKINAEARGISLIFELDKKLLMFNNMQQHIAHKEQQLKSLVEDSVRIVKQREVLKKQKERLQKNSVCLRESIEREKKALHDLRENIRALNQKLYPERQAKAFSLIERM